MFRNNAATIGSAIDAGATNIIINKTVFYNNSAIDTGALYLAGCSVSFISIAIVKQYYGKR